MLNRLFLNFGLLITYISSTFAFSLKDSFETSFGSNGLGGLLTSTQFLYFFYFLVIFAATFQLFKFSLKFLKLPDKAATTVSLMFSFIGVSGVFYMFGGSQRYLVSFFGTFFGFVILFVLLASVIIPLIKAIWGNPENGKITKIFYGLLVIFFGLIIFTGFLGTSELGFAQSLYNNIIGLIGTLLPFVVLFGLIHLFRNVKDRSDEISNDPKLGSIKSNVTQIDKDLKDISDNMKEFREVYSS